VFPCDPKSGEPLVEWRACSTTDIAGLEALWQRNPDAVPAIDLGKAGLLVVEPRYGDHDNKARNGFRAFEQLARDHGWDIVTSAIRSPDGLHYYFRQPEGEPLESLASLSGHNIEIHGKGGYVIGPRGSPADRSNRPAARQLPGDGCGAISGSTSPCAVLSFPFQKHQ
jgi:hypothetical protein